LPTTYKILSSILLSI